MKSGSVCTPIAAVVFDLVTRRPALKIAGITNILKRVAPAEEWRTHRNEVGRLRGLTTACQ